MRAPDPTTRCVVGRRRPLRDDCATRRLRIRGGRGQHDGGMTYLTDSSPAPSLVLERQRVLDDLNLSMLFLETAQIETIAPGAELEEDASSADVGRRLRVRLRTRSPLTPAATAALLCRFLHNHRIPGVEIDRVAEGVRLRCAYLLPSGRWRLDVIAPIP